MQNNTNQANPNPQSKEIEIFDGLIVNSQINASAFQYKKSTTLPLIKFAFQKIRRENQQDNFEIVITKDEYSAIVGLKKKKSAMILEMKQSVKDIENHNSFQFKENKYHYRSDSLTTRREINERGILLDFNPKFGNNINCKSNYCPQSIKQLNKHNTPPPQQLYSILLPYTDNSKGFSVSINELQLILNLTQYQDKAPKEFTKRIKVFIKNINNKNDILITFSLEKSSNKTIGYNFIVTSKQSAPALKKTKAQTADLINWLTNTGIEIDKATLWVQEKGKDAVAAAINSCVKNVKKLEKREGYIYTCLYNSKYTKQKST